MVRSLVLLLLATAPFARAFPTERPVSEARVGIAAETMSRSMIGTPGEDRVLVTWSSIGRGGQAVVLDAAGNRTHDTSIALPLTASVVYWHDGGWTIVGPGEHGWGAVRLSRDGVLDPVVRPFEVVREAVWTGSALVAVRTSGKTIVVDAYDADLQRTMSWSTATDSSVLPRIDTDGETALITYQENRLPQRTVSLVLTDAHGALLKAREVDYPGWVLATGSRGGGNGYVAVTETAVQSHVAFGSYHVDHDLRVRTGPAAFGRPEPLFTYTPRLAWDGSAFAFFYIGGEAVDEGAAVRGVRLSEEGAALDDAIVTSTHHGTLRTDTGLATVAGMGTTFLLYMRGQGVDFSVEPQFLRFRAGSAVAGLAASGEVELERGAMQQVRPAAASNATQSLVAWRERVLVTAPHVVYATRVDAAGNVRDPQSLLLGTTSCAETTPSVATNGDSFLVTWYDDAGVMSALIGADGTVAARTRIQHFRSDPCVEVAATALSNGTDYLVAWRRAGETRDPVVAARLAANGTLLDEVPVDLGSAVGRIHGASNGTDYLLAWDGRMIRVGANGTRLDAKIGVGMGTRVAGTATIVAWWNGTSYSLVQHERPSAFVNEYRLAHVAANGTVLDAGSPASWPAYGAIWGESPFACVGTTCTLLAGTIEDGAYFLQQVRVVDDGVAPFLRLGDRSPIAPVLRREPLEQMSLVPFGVPGARRLVALTRYALDHPYSGISRVFLRPVEVVRGRAVRH